jgi:hypothetical protein
MIVVADVASSPVPRGPSSPLLALSCPGPASGLLLDALLTPPSLGCPHLQNGWWNRGLLQAGPLQLDCSGPSPLPALDAWFSPSPARAEWSENVRATRIRFDSRQKDRCLRPLLL